MAKDEIFLPVVGFEGKYEVSQHGEVRSLDRTILRSNGTMQRFKGRVLNPFKNSAGYRMVRLSDQSNGFRLVARVHRLVAEAFIPNTENKKEVNHIDGDKYNSVLSNLEWATPKENRTHAWRTGLRGRQHLPNHIGEDKHNAKLSDESVREIRRLHKLGFSYKRLSIIFGVHKKTVICADKGKTWSHVCDGEED